MNGTMEIKVRPLVEGLKSIDKAHVGEWYDLRAAKDISLEPGEYCEVPLGVAIELPEGFEAIVASRSSSFKKWGIMPVNGIGVIDHRYCGDQDEWKFPVIAFRKTRINKNDRICQFRILYGQPECNLRTVDRLGNANRGGIGSTGGA